MIYTLSAEYLAQGLFPLPKENEVPAFFFFIASGRSDTTFPVPEEIVYFISFPSFFI